MFILGNFVYSVAHLLEALITILYWLIIVRALISWVNPDPFNPIVQFLHRVTEPMLDDRPDTGSHKEIYTHTRAPRSIAYNSVLRPIFFKVVSGFKLGRIGDEIKILKEDAER